MKSLTRHLTLEVPARRGFVNLTSRVEALVAESGIREGLCLVNAMHITASVIINEDGDAGGRGFTFAGATERLRRLGGRRGGRVLQMFQMSQMS